MGSTPHLPNSNRRTQQQIKKILSALAPTPSHSLWHQVSSPCPGHPGQLIRQIFFLLENRAKIGCCYSYTNLILICANSNLPYFCSSSSTRTAHNEGSSCPAQSRKPSAAVASCLESHCYASLRYFLPAPGFPK